MGRLLFLVVAALACSGCYLAHERAADAGPVPDAGRPPDAPTGGLVWALVHPTDAPMGPGLFLLDERSGTILRHLPLPPDLTSPNALAWDGTSLWVNDLDDFVAPGLFELSPDDGSVRSSAAGPLTEGLAWDPESRQFWGATLSAVTRLVRFDRAGMPIETRETGEGTIQDLVLDDAGRLFYLVNDDLDRIVRVDLEARSQVELTRGVDSAPYALGFDGRHVVAAMWGHARRYDPDTGALVSDTPFPVPGWITGIAFVR